MKQLALTQTLWVSTITARKIAQQRKQGIQEKLLWCMYVCMYVYFYFHYKLIQLLFQMKEGKCISPRQQNFHPEDARSNMKEGGKNIASPYQFWLLQWTGVFSLIHFLVSFLNFSSVWRFLMLAGNWLNEFAALHLKLSLARSKVGWPVCLIELLRAWLVFL